MGQRGLSVGARMDGTLDVDIKKDDEEGEEGGWNTNNLTLQEAEFLHEELARVIARQKERGFPKTLQPAAVPPATS